MASPNNPDRPRPRRRSFLGELWAFMRVRKVYWLAPILVVLLLLSVLFFLAQSAGPLSAFIYAF